MSRTIYATRATGLTLYAKPSPTSATPAWGTDVVSLTENGTTGEYSATVGDGPHRLYQQAGGSPASSDKVIGVYDAAAALASNYNATRAGHLDKLAVSGTLAHSNDAATYKATGFAVAGDAMTLTSGEREATAVVVESHLLDEGDSQMLINAIVGAIGNTNIDQAILIAAIRADLERSGGNLNTLITRIAGTIRTAADDVTAETAQTTAMRDGLALEATAQSIKGKTDGLTFTVENQVDVNVKSYNGTLQSNGDLPLKIDAVKGVVDSIVAKTDNLPESPAATSDVQVTVEPDITVNPTELSSGERAEIATAVWAKELSEGNTAASFVMRLTSSVAQLFERLATMIEDSTGWRWTTKALETGPSGGGGGGSGDAEQATLLLVKAKTDLIGVGTVAYNSPVAADGTIPKIYQGDDYAGGRAIAFTFNSSAFTIAGSTSRFEAQPVEGDSFGADGTVTDNNNGTATLSVSISSAQSQLLQTGPVTWSALVITSSGGRQTVTSGKSPLETRKHE
jgi:hypothetical protein